MLRIPILSDLLNLCYQHPLVVLIWTASFAILLRLFIKEWKRPINPKLKRMLNDRKRKQQKH